MHDDLATRKPKSVLNEMLAAATQGKPVQRDDQEEDACPAFGFLRGVRDRALALELRFRDGNSDFLSYNLLASFRHHPGAGVLLKFAGDVITLVLIRGSNLDLLADGHPVNLTDRGLQRHRVTFVKEMDEEELRRAGDRQPTIDRIEVAEFQTQEESLEWIKRKAAVFVRQ